jgi:hypothetical protein
MKMDSNKYLISFTLILMVYFGISCKHSRQTNKKQTVIQKHIELISLDGQKVTILGTYIKYNPVPNIRRDNIEYLSGILFDDDTIPGIFLEMPRPDNEQDEYNGKKVIVSGVFHKIMPVLEADSQVVSRYSGSWIYKISRFELLNE